MAYLLFLLDIKQVIPFFNTLVRYGPMEKQEILLKIERFYIQNNNKCNIGSIYIC